MAKIERKLSLAPLTFDEAVTGILKIKPGPKQPPQARRKAPLTKKSAAKTN
jgi:hypothetical protein